MLPQNLHQSGPLSGSPFRIEDSEQLELLRKHLPTRVFVCSTMSEFKRASHFESDAVEHLF
jgi:hypothetical protein